MYLPQNLYIALGWCSHCYRRYQRFLHYSDAIMSAMVFQIASISIVDSTVCPCADQVKHQSFASLAFVKGIHRRQRASNAENVSIWWRHHVAIYVMWTFIDIFFFFWGGGGGGKYRRKSTSTLVLTAWVSGVLCPPCACPSCTMSRCVYMLLAATLLTPYDWLVIDFHEGINQMRNISVDS